MTKKKLYSFDDHPEHVAELEKIKQKYIANAMRTDAMTWYDRDMMREAMRGLYKNAGIKYPGDHKIIFVASPLIAQFASGIAMSILHGNKKSGARQAAEQAARQAEQAARQAARQAAGQAAEQAARQAAEQAARQAEQAAGQARQAGQAAEQAARQGAEQAAGQAARQAGQAARQARQARQAAEQAARQAAEQAGQAAGQARQGAEQAAGQAARQAAGQARQGAEQAAEQAGQAARQAAEQAARQAAGQAAEQAGQAARQAEQAAEQAGQAEQAAGQDTKTKEMSLNIFIKGFLSVTKKYGIFANFSVNFSWYYRTRSSLWPWYQVFGDFFKNIAKLPGDWDKWTPLNLDALHGGVRFMTPEFTIISDRPEILKMDEQGRLHAENGPSIKWRDGMEQYYWHGLSIPDHWILDKKSLTPEIALTWRNVEERRAACEIIGWANVLEHPSLNPKVINEDEPHIGTLIQVDLPDAPAQWFLKYRCGTGRWFAESVNDKTFDTALKANAGGNGWRPGKDDPESYIPIVRT